MEKIGKENSDRDNRNEVEMAFAQVFAKVFSEIFIF